MRPPAHRRDFLGLESPRYRQSIILSLQHIHTLLFIVGGRETTPNG